MYQKPDFVKVKVEISDNYAAYACTPNHSYVDYYTESATVLPKCQAKVIEDMPMIDYQQPTTFTCYTTLNPAGY